MLLVASLIAIAFLLAVLGFTYAAWGEWLPAAFWLGLDAISLIHFYHDAEALYSLATGTILAWTVVFLLNEHFTEEFHGNDNSSIH